MEQIKERYSIVLKTMAQLENAIKSMDKAPECAYEIYRGNLIQCFEYTIDTFWKYLKMYMQDYKSIAIDIANPKGILRAAKELNFITQEELAQLIIAITDRNLTSHAYNEDLAEEVIAHIPNHYKVLHDILDRVKIE